MAYLKNRNRVNGIGIRIVETGDIFETRTQCANFIGVSVGMISMYFAGKVRNVKGYHLEFVEMDFEHHLTDEIVDDLYELTGIGCEWREHPWRPDLYVSDCGIIAKNVRGRIVIKEQYVMNSGYLAVSVEDYRTKKTKNSNQLVHRLVAETYLEPVPGKNFVNHIDGDKFNNCVENLEYCTRSENMRHAYNTGLHQTEEVMIDETGEIFSSAAECARVINGTACGICDCKNGRQKKHRNYHFRFPENGHTFDLNDHLRFLGVIAVDEWTGEEAYFDDIQEIVDMLGFSREDVIMALEGKIDMLDHYRFEYAGREDRLLYGDESNKLLSWIQIGIL